MKENKEQKFKFCLGTEKNLGFGLELDIHIIEYERFWGEYLDLKKIKSNSLSSIEEGVIDQM